jgi:hypothetical protein
VTATIFGICHLSFAVTHLIYLRFVREEMSALVSWLRHLAPLKRAHSSFQVRLIGAEAP